MYQFPHYREQVPKALKDGPWVGCDAEKVPEIVGTNRRASTTDPKTWRSYQEALVAHEGKRHVGIGRVIVDGEGLVGVDLDNVRNDDGITPEALTTLRQLDSYSEVSPSGRGVKVWVFARLKRSYKRGGLEVYKGGRYFTVTGQILSQFSASMEERQEELEALVRREFPARRRQIATADYDGPKIDLADYLSQVQVLAEVHDGVGVKYAVRCPWAEEHTNGLSGTYVGQRHSGATWFYCHHAHCAGRGWKEFKKGVPPGYWLAIRRPGYTGNMEVRVSHG